jgi:hypothetical protein
LWNSSGLIEVMALKCLGGAGGDFDVGPSAPAPRPDGFQPRPR